MDTNRRRLSITEPYQRTINERRALIEIIRDFQDGRLMRFYSDRTGRQKETIELVSMGFTNDEASDILGIQPQGVAEHLTNIYAELSTFDEFAGIHHKRWLLANLFNPFFMRHKHLSNFKRASSPKEN